MFSKIATTKSIATYWEQIAQLHQLIDTAEAIVIGAGAGMSAAAGLTYSGPRFEEHFSDFIARYHFRDMYEASFYPFTTWEEYWAYWSRHIYWNRYDQPLRATYQQLLEWVKGKNYFVLTTNVDHCFQQAGFDKERLFYTQGDYGLWQCSRPCQAVTYDNEWAVRRMLIEQQNMRIPSTLIPYCPNCGRPLTMNLRCDDRFVEDAGWQQAHRRYEDFLWQHRNCRTVFLELGVGGNTPVIIKYPFWRLTKANPQANYICINIQESFSPREIAKQSLCITGDIGQVLLDLTKR